ncbi:MAG: DUF1080 domain-containing protein [Phycisphaerae bacterium]|nr:DUF1080 domain-containing protein [Phycisphaerae bacterium]
MKKSRLYLNIGIMLLSAATLTTSLSCKPGNRPDDARKALFDGKTFQGWTVYMCDASVDDGSILLEEGNGLVQTEKQYGDFILEFEWKSMKEDAWDSGVYFRYDSVPEGYPWPEKYQVNMKKGLEGNVENLEGATSQGLFKAGEWNQFKLTVQGTQASLEINGQPAWQADGLEGPEKGYIGLQSEVQWGGQNRFRNIYLTELEKPIQAE